MYEVINIILQNFPYIATGPHLGPHFKNIVLIIDTQIYKMLSYFGPNVGPFTILCMMAGKRYNHNTYLGFCSKYETK